MIFKALARQLRLVWLVAAWIFLFPAAAMGLSIEEGKQALAAGELRKAEALFSELASQQTDADARRWLGITYFKQQDFRQAIKHLQLASAAAPEQAENHYASGVVNLARAQTLSPLRVRGPIKAAIRDFDKALELDPDHLGARFYLAQILVNAPKVAGGDRERAKVLNEFFREHSPAHAAIIDAALDATAGEIQAAEAHLLKLHQSDASFSPALFQLCDLYVNSEQFEKAVPFCEQFLSQAQPWDGNDPISAHYLLGRAQLGLGNREQAEAQFQIIQQTSKNKRLLKRVERQLRGDFSNDEDEAEISDAQSPPEAEE